jgi:hypothetical protein
VAHVVADDLETRVLLSASGGGCGCSASAVPDTVSVGELATAPLNAAPAGPASPVPVVVEVPEQLAAASSADAFNTTPTAWEWHTGVDGAFLGSRADAGNRIVDLEVESSFPLRFTAALVQNSGTYAKEWYWNYDQTFQGIGAIADANNRRITDIEVYPIGPGQFRYAALMVPNTGAENKDWWWGSGASSGDIQAQLTQHNARLVDLEGYDDLGTRRYAYVMISNTGTDARGWWYYYGQTPSQIGSLIDANNARLVDIEPVDPGHFDIIMEAGQAQRWYWGYARDAQTTLDFAEQPGRGHAE